MAQIHVDSARGLVGKELVLPLVYTSTVPLDQDREVVVKGEFKLSNPTVFFPQVFRASPKVALLDSTLDSSTDSTWSFSVQFRTNAQILPDDSLFSLVGEALAGSDSVTSVMFHSLEFDDASVPGVTGTIVTRSVGTRIPYVRFATLDPGRPNPTAPGITVTWGFRIDKASDVTFKIYDMIGQEVEVEDLGWLEPGVYVNTFTPDFFFPSGMFYVRLETNSGEASQVMHVLR